MTRLRNRERSVSKGGRGAVRTPRVRAGRVVTIHSEPSSCQRRGWSRHPAPPQSANGGSHTRGWSHSCRRRWGCPRETAHKSQAGTTTCLQVQSPKEKAEGPKVKELNQVDPVSSSSSPHSVHRSKTKAGFPPVTHNTVMLTRWEAFLQALWTRPETWGW